MHHDGALGRPGPARLRARRHPERRSASLARSRPRCWPRAYGSTIVRSVLDRCSRAFAMRRASAVSRPGGKDGRASRAGHRRAPNPDVRPSEWDLVRAGPVELVGQLLDARCHPFCLLRRAPPLRRRADRSPHATAAHRGWADRTAGVWPGPLSCRRACRLPAYKSMPSCCISNSLVAVRCPARPRLAAEQLELRARAQRLDQLIEFVGLA